MDSIEKLVHDKTFTIDDLEQMFPKSGTGLAGLAYIGFIDDTRYIFTTHEGKIYKYSFSYKRTEDEE